MTLKNITLFSVTINAVLLKLKLKTHTHTHTAAQLFSMVLEMFLAHQHISILEWFLKDHVILKTEVMAAETSALPSQKWIAFKNILKYKTVILNIFKIIYFKILLFLLYFWSNNCRIGEHNTLKNIKYFPYIYWHVNRSQIQIWMNLLSYFLICYKAYCCKKVATSIQHALFHSL